MRLLHARQIQVSFIEVDGVPRTQPIQIAEILNN